MDGIAVPTHRKGGGDAGLFVANGTLGAVTISAVSPAYPKVNGTGVIAVDNYPSIAPRNGNPLHFGADQSGRGRRHYRGDIDRIRIYNRALTPEELAAHAAGEGLTSKSIVGDWTFDKLVDGVFPNVAGKGLAGKIVGDVEHIIDEDAYVRFSGEYGFVNVAHDQRLTTSKGCTLEAWIRPKEGMGNGVVLDKSWTGSTGGFRLCAGTRGISIKGIFGWLEAGIKCPPDAWTHIVAVCDVNGVRKAYVNGKLVGDRQMGVIIVVP